MTPQEDEEPEQPPASVRHPAPKIALHLAKAAAAAVDSAKFKREEVRKLQEQLEAAQAISL